MKRLLGMINVGNVHRNITAFIVYLMFKFSQLSSDFQIQYEEVNRKLYAVGSGNTIALNLSYLHKSSSRNRTFNHEE